MIVVGLLAGCDGWNGEANRSPSQRTASDCGYSASHLSERDSAKRSARRQEQLAARQPSALALNDAGESVCAYVHADPFLYLRGSDRPLPVSGAGRIELRFEAPVAEIHPVFPEDGCGEPGSLQRLDEKSWSFTLSSEILSGECFAIEDWEAEPEFTFSFDARYGDGGTFKESSMDYGLTVALQDL
jgi:hypothetical protein